MVSDRPGVALAVAVVIGLLVGGAFPRALAQAPPTGPRAKKSVYGKLDSVSKRQNGIVMISDDNKRLAWKFDAPVIEEIEKVAPGHPMIVIYRQVSSNEKRVTAVAFPGAASVPTYVNLTGDRVTLKSAPMVSGGCGQSDAGPVQEVTIPREGIAETEEACWCCAAPDQTCAPGNKTGVGRALLVSCFE